MASAISPVIRRTRVNNLIDFRAPHRLDMQLLGVVLALLGFGLLMVYSTSCVLGEEKFGDPLYFVKRQGVAVLLGLVLLYALCHVPLGLLQRLSPWCLAASLALLVLPMVPGIGESAGGAKRWVYLMGLRFQPGEFSKLLFIVFLAGYLARQEDRLHTFVKGIALPFGLMGLVGLLYILKPDFGSVVVLGAITLIMALTAGSRLRHILIGAVVCATAAVMLVAISPYRLKRIVAFLSPFDDPAGKGYQLIQSLIAIGAGGPAGVGLGASQQKLFYLPASHTDFIFAVISEELGLAGASLVLAAVAVILWRGISIAWRQAEDVFAFSLAIGLTGLIVIPALLNVGVVTGLLPTKGMVLPFIAYGGSSLITSLAAVGLLLAISRTKAK